MIAELEYYYAHGVKMIILYFDDTLYCTKEWKIFVSIATQAGSWMTHAE